MTPRRLITTATAVAALAMNSLPVHAAIVTWTAATDIVGDTDVSTQGTLVGAFNLGRLAQETTVNGVTFAALAVPLVPSQQTVSSGNFSLSGSFVGTGTQQNPGAPFENLSASYQNLLRSLVVFSTNSGLVLTLSNLLVGEVYEFQWWNSTSNATSPYLTTAQAGNSVTLSANSSSTLGGLGQFAVGRFTSDSTSQVITFSGLEDPGLNAFQLRLLSQTVPEPGTLALLGVALLGLKMQQRRRGAAAAPVTAGRERK